MSRSSKSSVSSDVTAKSADSSESTAALAEAAQTDLKETGMKYTGPLSSIVGERVMSASGDLMLTTSLEVKRCVIGLYFTARWFPLAKSFRRKLMDWWDEASVNNPNLVIFACFMEDNLDHFLASAKHLPDGWFYLPWQRAGKSSVANWLSRKYRVASVPGLAFIEADTGATVLQDGVELVLQDPTGKSFRAQTLALDEAIPETDLFWPPAFKGDIARPYDKKRLCNHYIVLYFGSMESQACDTFEPVLRQMYDLLYLGPGVKMEVIYVNADPDVNVFTKKFCGQPWPALPHDSDLRLRIAQRFRVESLPRIVVLDYDYKVIQWDATAQILRDPNGEHFPWKYEVVNELTESVLDDLNFCQCVIWGTDGSVEEASQAEKTLLPLGQLYDDEEKTLGDWELKFMYIGKDRETRASLLRVLRINHQPDPFLFLLDLPSSRLYVYHGDLDRHSIEMFILDCFHGRVDFLNISGRHDKPVKSCRQL